jgi:hypothetical protein
MLSAAPWQDFADSSDSETDSNASPSQTSDNVAPAFNKTDTDPEVVFEVDAVGVPRNVSVAGTFWDPDESDQHQLSIEWADGVMGDGSQNPIDIAFGDRSFNVVRPFDLSWMIRDIYPVILTLEDDNSGEVSTLVQAKPACRTPQMTLVTLQTGIPADLKDIHFKNPAGAVFDLNKPGPLFQAKKRVVRNVHWVVFRGTMLDDCRFSRFVTGTFRLNGVKITRNIDKDVPLEPLDGDQPVKPEPKYIDTALNGIALHELVRGDGFVVVADAPGTSLALAEIIKNNKGDIEIDFKWHFLISSRSLMEKHNVAFYGYDVEIKGIMVDGKFISTDLEKGGDGINAATHRLKWDIGT